MDYEKLFKMKTHPLDQKESRSTPSEVYEYKPSVCFSQEQIPELKGKNVGDKLILVINAKITGVREDEKRGTRYDLDLERAGVYDKKEKT